MDLDKAIVITGEKVRRTLSESGLTLGIMQLILKDILRTVEIQQHEKMAEEAMQAAGKPPETEEAKEEQA